jgi:hypothetical protein
MSIVPNSGYKFVFTLEIIINALRNLTNENILIVWRLYWLSDTKPQNFVPIIALNIIDNNIWLNALLSTIDSIVWDPMNDTMGGQWPPPDTHIQRTVRYHGTTGTGSQRMVGNWYRRPTWDSVRTGSSSVLCCGTSPVPRCPISGALLWRLNHHKTHKTSHKKE